MLVIRLARTGRTKYPTYRIVAAESARAATSKFVEVLGHYNPHTKELIINHESAKKRLSQGAQPSNTVIKLMTKEKIKLPAWVKLKTKTPKKSPGASKEAGPLVTAEEPGSSSEAESGNAAAVDNQNPAAQAPTEDEVRVAEVAEDRATEVEDNTPNINDTERA